MGDLKTLRLKIAQLAVRQWGHVTRQQLLKIGMPATMIAAWVRDGKLVPVHNGVYAVGYRRVEPVARAMAAVLACGPAAVLSHESAAALWTLRRWPRVAEVTVASDRRPAGIVVHRSRTLTSRDTTVQLAVPVTTAARTLCDIRPRVTARQFTRLVNRARLDHRLDAGAADALLGGSTPTHPRHPTNPSRSGLEDDFDRWIGRQRLPAPLRNVRTEAGHEVDALYPEHRVIVEVDDFATHGDRATFAADRERDAAHAALGYTTVRLVRERLTSDEARRLLATLTRRSRL